LLRKGDFMDESGLISGAKQGDRKCLELLLSNNYSILYGYINKITLNPQLSQDIVQETMLKAMINLHKYQPKGKFSTWLITIATNIYRDYLRKNKASIDIDCISIGLEDVEQRVLDRLDLQQVKSILLSLSHEKRISFVLKHYYGYKYDEIARITNTSQGTVKSRIYNAVKEIQNALERSRVL